MPIDIEKTESGDLTLFRASGVITFDEQMAVLTAFYGGQPTKNVVWDFRKLEGSRISTEELNAILDFISRKKDFRTDGKTALVANSDIDFGLSRMSGMMGEAKALNWKIRAFRSMAEALAWIGQPMDGE